MSGPSEVNPEDEKISKDKPLTTCAKCSLAIVGQFVRALGGTYHLDCFKCEVSMLALEEYHQTIAD
jgi:hypothetical protein